MHKATTGLCIWIMQTFTNQKNISLQKYVLSGTPVAIKKPFSETASTSKGVVIQGPFVSERVLRTQTGNSLRPGELQLGDLRSTLQSEPYPFGFAVRRLSLNRWLSTILTVDDFARPGHTPTWAVSLGKTLKARAACAKPLHVPHR